MGSVTITFEFGPRHTARNRRTRVEVTGRLVGLRRVISLAATVFEVGTVDIVGQYRDARCVEARHAAMWVARRTLPVSLPQIGRAFGDRDHTTVLSALRSAERRRSRCEEFRRLTDALVEAVTKLQALEEQTHDPL